MTANTSSQPGSLVERLNASAEDFERPPSIQSQANIRAINAMHEAASRIAELERNKANLDLIWPALQQFAHDTGAMAGTDIYKWFAEHTDTLRARWKVQDELFARAQSAEAALLALREKYEGAAQSQPILASNGQTDAEPSGMIERVAQAITAERHRLAAAAMAGGAIGLGLDDDIGRKLARAAIEAMREPTQHMVEMGSFGLNATGLTTMQAISDAKDAYQAMIDAALADAESGEGH